MNSGRTTFCHFADRPGDIERTAPTRIHIDQDWQSCDVRDKSQVGRYVFHGRNAQIRNAS
jgi:hypothetical protein